MKTRIRLFIFIFLLTATLAFANDVSIDSNGNISTGVSNPTGSGNLDVTGASGEHAISGFTSGTGAAGIYGASPDSSGWAGYFNGNTRITGDLTVDGGINASFNETDPQVGLLTEDKWCKYNAPYVNCLEDAPVLTESDPVYLGSPANGISAGQITNWDTAYGWGNHASAGYDTSSDGWQGSSPYTFNFVGIGTSTPTRYIDIKGMAQAFIGLDFGTNNNAGITFLENGTARWIFPFFRGWQSDNMIIREENANIDVMTFQAATGNVGVGTSSPGKKLTVSGNVQVEGTGNGITYPDGTKQTTAYRGFPRPDYDSGWVTYSAAEITLTHNLGGNIDNYVIDLTFKDNNGPHIGALGGDWRVAAITHIPGFDPTFYWEQAGVHWKNLTSSTIKINSSYTYAVDKVRLRIWVYQ